MTDCSPRCITARCRRLARRTVAPESSKLSASAYRRSDYVRVFCYPSYPLSTAQIRDLRESGRNGLPFDFIYVPRLFERAPITKGPETDMRMKILKLTKGAAAITATVVVLAACTSNPVADEKIAVAKASVQRAEGSGAPEYAPVELAAARDELARAEKKNADRDLQPAVMLAERANIDAELAEATAQQQRSHKAAVEFDASMQTLQQESQRSSPPTQ
jgi:hypothetical protein